MAKNDLLSISEAAERLNRKARTLRDWESSGRLPGHLYPDRDEFGRRRYSEDLVEHIREWLIAEGRRHSLENLIHARVEPST